MGALSAAVKGPNVRLLRTHKKNARKEGVTAMETKFGPRIKQLRTAKGMTLDQLAQVTGSAKSYIWELENKDPPRPSADKLSTIAAALGVTVDYLMGREDQTLAEAEDKAFFREYSGLPEATRRQLREIAKTLGAKPPK